MLEIQMADRGEMPIRGHSMGERGEMPIREQPISDDRIRELFSELETTVL